MKMRKQKKAFTLAMGILLSAAGVDGQLLALGSEISVSGRKDVILSGEKRGTVLEVAERTLSEDETTAPEFSSNLETLESPFLFEQPAEIIELVEETEPEPEPIIYDDASVLNAVSAIFSKKVRGSLTRGGVSFLQLEGGALVRPGTTFPAKLPQLKDQSFEVTIEAISAEAYVLTLGEARIRMDYDRADVDSGRIQFSD